MGTEYSEDYLSIMSEMSPLELNIPIIETYVYDQHCFSLNNIFKSVYGSVMHDILRGTNPLLSKIK